MRRRPSGGASRDQHGLVLLAFAFPHGPQQSNRILITKAKQLQRPLTLLTACKRSRSKYLMVMANAMSDERRDRLGRSGAESSGVSRRWLLSHRTLDRHSPRLLDAQRLREETGNQQPPRW